jgi:DhnA family fructose-bisphosphate aldolase class Ia
LSAGAAGVSIGRNVFQHKDPERMVQKICRIVHNSTVFEEKLRKLEVKV